MWQVSSLIACHDFIELDVETAKAMGVDVLGAVALSLTAIDSMAAYPAGEMGFQVNRKECPELIPHGVLNWEGLQKRGSSVRSRIGALHQITWCAFGQLGP